MRIDRRSWLSLVLPGSAHLVAAPRAGAQTPPETPPFRIATGPYLQNPSGDAMTVAWITDRDATGTVEYGAPGLPVRRAVSSHHGLIDSNERIHKVVLRDLTPGATYRYRVVSREILKFGSNRVTFGTTAESPFQEFRTFDRRKPECSFLVFNDMHDTPAIFADLLRANRGRPFDFVMLNGDTVGHVSREEQIAAILDAAVANFASRVPLIWVRGNHETRGGLARQLPRYLDLPEDRYYYSFGQGPVHFIVLDTGEDKVDDHVEYSGLVDFYRYREDEARWLAAEVRTEAFRRAPLRVVICHMPFPLRHRPRIPAGQVNPFTGMAHAYEHFGPILEQAGIDMMISGHLHSAAVTDAEPGRHSYPVVRGGGPDPRSRTMIRVEARGNALEAFVLRPDGSTVGTCQVTAKR